MNSAAAPAANFNRLARPYRWLEYLSFGPFLSRARRHFLSRLAERRHALVFGDGDGRFTASLLRVNPIVEVDAIDASPAMLQSLASRCAPHSRRLTTHCADARSWEPEIRSRAGSKYDLIATHFFLDCLTTEEIVILAARLFAVTTPDAVWVISDFAIPNGFFGRVIAAPLVAALYRAFRLLTGLGPQVLPNHRQALASAGWMIQAKRHQLHGLLVSEIWNKTTS